MFKDIKTIDIKPQLATNVNVKYTGAIVGKSFFNATGAEIYVTTRDGITTQIDPTIHNNETGNFIIRTNLIFDKEESVNVPIENEEEDVIQVYYDSFVDSTEYRYTGKRSLHYDNVLSLKELRESDGAIYIRNLDLLVSLTKKVDINIHPFSAAASTRRLLQRIKDEKKEFTSFDIKLVDNSGDLTTQYIKVAGTVQAIQPVKDLNCKSGVYIAENKAVKNTTSDPKRKVNFHPLEHHRIDYSNYKEPLIFSRYEDAFNFKDVLEIEKLKTERAENDFKDREMKYKEREMALKQRDREKDITFKDIENRHKEMELEYKEKLLHLENNARDEEEKINALKRKHQMEMARERNRLTEMELKLKEQQARYAESEIKHKEELLRIKEEYEIKSANRKNLSDIIRSTPVIVAGVATIATAIYSATKNNN